MSPVSTQNLSRSIEESTRVLLATAMSALKTYIFDW